MYIRCDLIQLTLVLYNTLYIRINIAACVPYIIIICICILGGRQQYIVHAVLLAILICLMLLCALMYVLPPRAVRESRRWTRSHFFFFNAIRTPGFVSDIWAIITKLNAKQYRKTFNYTLKTIYGQCQHWVLHFYTQFVKANMFFISVVRY